MTGAVRRCAPRGGALCYRPGRGQVPEVFCPVRTGPDPIDIPVALAPMAGVADYPFRTMCRSFGAAWCVSEMVTADAGKWDTPKSRQRLRFLQEPGPRIVQIVGADPRQMAEAARRAAGLGADMIDINMGCPAKKVCRTFAGSALMGDEAVVARLLDAVVDASPVPVTLKIRTGLDHSRKNGTRIALIAQASGVHAIAIHGRTRACGFRGQAEHETARCIRQQTRLPVVVNGDIDAPEKARKVLATTGADAIMIGRGALGRPWLFREMRRSLDNHITPLPPTNEEVRDTMLTHLEHTYSFYGEKLGVRFGRKHLRWYSSQLRNGQDFWSAVCRVETSRRQLTLVDRFLAVLGSECEACVR